jgi:hypothetical protein
MTVVALVLASGCSGSSPATPIDSGVAEDARGGGAGSPVAGASGGGASGAGHGGVAGAAGGAGGARDAGGVSDAGGDAVDECRRDEDCPQPTCIRAPCPTAACAFAADGAHHCVTRVAPTLSQCPTEGGVQPCCTSDAACTMHPGGVCVPYAYNYCGGPAPWPGNQCQYDACRSDADCTAQPHGICTAGFPRTCLYGACRTNADCTRGPGGRCTLGKTPAGCAQTVVYCAYDGDPCKRSQDCGMGTNGLARVCAPNANLQGRSCQQQQPPPP